MLHQRLSHPTLADPILIIEVLSESTEAAQFATAED